MTIDWGLLCSGVGILFLLGAAFLKNYVSIAATTARSLANEAKVKELEHMLNGHKFMAVSTFVTNATLKEAVSSFGASIDRLTDRIDRVMVDRAGTDA